MNSAQLAYSLLEAEDWTPEGYVQLETANVGDYAIKLWQGSKHIKGNAVKFYEISLNRHGLSFDPDSQEKRYTGGHHALGQRHDMLRILGTWISKYGTLLVGSYNPDKLGFYYRLLTRYLPRTCVSEPFSPFDESEGVADYFTVGDKKTVQPVGESDQSDQEVDPQRYIDDLPSVMDNMKAAALRRFNLLLPGIDRDNFCEWADEIAGAIVHETMNPKLKYDEGRASVASAFQELSAYLVRYGDQTLPPK